jgi:ammonium transporter Rh
MTSHSKTFEAIYVISEIIIFLLYLFFTEGVQFQHESEATSSRESVRTYYALFMDVHVLIFIGFGFQMVFLKTQSWTAVVYNFIISTYAL